MKAFRMAIASCVLVMAALLSAPAFGQSKGSATLSGRIVDDQGKPVADAVVQRVRVGKGVELWIPWQLRVMFFVARFVPRGLWRRMPR